MRRNTKLLIGLATVVPLAVFLLMGAALMAMLPIAPEEIRDRVLGAWLPAVVVITVYAVTLLVGYFYHLYRINPMPAREKRIWELLLLFFGWVSMPVYWYRYVWRDETGGTGHEK